MSLFNKSSKKRVLVVDDEPMVVDIACESLESAGFETAKAGNAAEAIAEMKKQAADALLLDIKLPDEDGLVFLAKFKKEFPAVPVVILTGSGYNEEMMQKALNSGASGYVSKDTDVENMVVAVKRVLK